MTLQHTDAPTVQSAGTSLFKIVSGLPAEQRFRQPADTLVVLGHQLELIVHESNIPVDMVIGTLRFSLFRVHQGRVAQLAPLCRSLVVFGEADVNPPDMPGVEFVALPPGSPLTQEWFVLVNSASFWGALIAQLVPDPRGSRRFSFDGIFTADDRLVGRAHLLLNLMLRRSMPALGERDRFGNRAHWAKIAYSLGTHPESERLGLQNGLLSLPELAELVTARELPNQQLFPTLLRLLNQYAGVVNSVLYRLVGNELIPLAWTVSRRPTALDIRSGVANRVFTDGEPALVQIEELQNERAALPDAQSAGAIPIVRDGHVWGLLLIGLTDADPFESLAPVVAQGAVSLLMQIMAERPEDAVSLPVAPPTPPAPSAPPMFEFDDIGIDLPSLQPLRATPPTPVAPPMLTSNALPPSQPPMPSNALPPLQPPMPSSNALPPLQPPMPFSNALPPLQPPMPSSNALPPLQPPMPFSTALPPSPRATSQIPVASLTSASSTPSQSPMATQPTAPLIPSSAALPPLQTNNPLSLPTQQSATPFALPIQKPAATGPVSGSFGLPSWMRSGGAVLPTETTIVPADPRPDQSWSSFQKRMISALVAFDERTAEQIWKEACDRYSKEDICTEMLIPIQIGVGEGWHRGEISVASEHFASRFVQGKLIHLLNTATDSTTGPLAVVGCAQGELHELGAIMVALFMRWSGIRVIFLGQNVPNTTIEDMIRDLRPQVLALSATTAEGAHHLIETGHIIARMEAPRPLFIYGGMAFYERSDLHARIQGQFLEGDVRAVIRDIAAKIREK